MDLQLKEKVIIITGAAKGIGRSIAEVFAKEDAIAVIVGRKAADNQKVVDEITALGKKADQFVAELSKPEDCEKTPAYETWIETLTDAQEKLNEITAKIPLENRMTTAEEIANMTVFLMSARSSHTTGQIIHVNGGYVHLDRALVNA